MAIGRLATLDNSSVKWPLQPASTNPAVLWIRSPRRPSELLPSSRATRSSGRVTTSSVLPRTNAPVEEALDEIDLLADGVAPPDLPLHGLGRAPAVEGDHRVPAAGVGGGQVLHQAGDLEAGGGGDVGPSAEDRLQRGGGLGVVVL